jgi:hypothetical protein
LIALAMMTSTMKTNRVRILRLAALTLLCLIPRAEAVSYGVNLIANGNAEAGSSSSTGAQVAVPSWTTTGAFTVIPYGAPNGYPTSGDPGPADRANQFFAGGNNAAVSTATQEIDLSSNTADINTGNVAYDLSGWFGGFSTDRDHASLTATFFNALTNLGSVTIGPATSKDRNFLTGFVLKEITGRVPVNTTRIVLTQTMTRVDGNSNDGYADSLSLVLSLKAGPATVNNSTFAGDGTRVNATGNWSDSADWTPAQVPNNTADNSYNATITGVTLTVPLSGQPGTNLTRTFGEARVDVDTVISNLNLTTAGVTSNGFFISEHSLTVLGTTNDQTFSQPSLDIQQPGFLIDANNNDVFFSLGNFANFSGTTLSGTKLDLESQGPSATIQFNGADIFTLNALVSLSGANTHIIDENGNDGLRDLAVIGQNSNFSVITRSFTTAGDLTINGSLSLQDLASGSSTIFTINGNLTNFDTAAHTLNGSNIGLFASATAAVLPTVSLKFNGADIVNNAANLSLSGPNAQILDQSSNDGLRNFAHNLATGTIFFTDHNFSSNGAFTNDGTMTVSAQSLATVFTINGALTNFDSTTQTLQSGSYSFFGSSSTPAATTTFRFNSADIVHNATSLRMGSGAMIRDESNRDGLRDFVDNEATGSFELFGLSFTAPSDFTNAGLVVIDNFDPSQVFSVASGHNYIQTGGETDMGSVGTLTAANVFIRGGILHDGGTINGNVAVETGTIAPTGFGGGGVANFQGFIVVVPGTTATPGPDAMTINGNLALAANAYFSLVINNTAAGEFDTMNVSGTASFGGRLEVALINGFTPQSGDSFTVLTAGPPITGAFANVASGSRIPTSDGHGSFIATYSDNHLILSNFETHLPDQLLNISTRGEVLTGNSVLIGGFIITGTDAKKVIIRGIGPSLSNFGLANVLADPTLELHDNTGATIATNDNWQDDANQKTQIEASGLAPSNELESAIVTTLQPGAYTAILQGKNGGTGIGLVEVFDLDQAANSKLSNISTRGFVDTNDNVMIGGFIIGGRNGGVAKVLVRAIGPSLSDFGVTGALQDPTVELHDGNGTILASNDNWKDSQEAEVKATGIVPESDFESAIVATLMPGSYTAIVRGKNNTTGVALVEVYDLENLCVPPPPDMVSWWPGDGNANDIQDGNNGTLQGGATFAPGKVGEAFSFASNTDKVLVPHNTNQNTGAQITLDAWVLIPNSFSDSVVTVPEIISKHTPNVNDGYRFELSNSPPRNAFNGLFIEITTTNGFFDLEVDNVITPGTWQHLAATYDGTTIRLFVNGVEVGNTPASGSIVPVTGDLTIGANNQSSSRVIDEVELFNRALSATEIGSIYAAGSAGKCKP